MRATFVAAPIVISVRLLNGDILVVSHSVAQARFVLVLTSFDTSTKECESAAPTHRRRSTTPNSQRPIVNVTLDGYRALIWRTSGEWSGRLTEYANGVNDSYSYGEMNDIFVKSSYNVYLFVVKVHEHAKIFRGYLLADCIRIWMTSRNIYIYIHIWTNLTNLLQSIVVRAYVRHNRRHC